MGVLKNPFAAPGRDERIRSPRRSPGCAPLAAWVLQRGLLLLIVPSGAGLLASSLGVAPFWLAFAVGGALWVPSTLLLLWHRFLAPVQDAEPVVLSSGLVMDREHFLWVLRLNTAERGLVGLILAAFAVQIFLLGGLGALLAPFILLFGFWFVWFSAQKLRLGEAIVAFVQDDAAAVIRLLEPLARWRRLNAPIQDTVRLHLGAARVRLGDPEGALDELRHVRRLRQADYARAQLLAGRGETARARELLGRAPPRDLGETLGHEMTEALLALEEEAPADVLARAEGWRTLEDEVSSRTRGTLHLLVAAAHEQAGDREAALAALDHSGVALEDRSWMAAAWPRWWGLLEAIRR